VIYHAALLEEWEAAQRAGTYTMSTRGMTVDEVGFVHAAHAHQLAGVLGRFYADVDEVVVLSIDASALTAPVREEPAGDAGDERFPHVYGPIPVSAVVAARRLRRGRGGSWDVDLQSRLDR
jgi:glutathione S-transferase